MVWEFKNYWCSSSRRPAMPATKPSWFSLDNSSRDLCLVSGRSSVEKIPVNMKKAKSSRLYRRFSYGELMNGGGKNIHMLHKLVGPTNVYQLGKANLGDDGTELARGSWDTVCGGTVTSGEDFSRNNEGGNVGAKVLEIIGEAVKNDESFGSRWCGGKLVITESCEFTVRKWKKKSETFDGTYP